MFKKYQNLLCFKGFYAKHKKLIISLVAIMVICSGLGMAVPYFISERLVALTDGSLTGVIGACAIVLGIFLMHHITWFLWTRWHTKLSAKVGFKLRAEIVQSFLSSKFAKIKGKTSGYYLERLNDDASQISNVLGAALGTLVDLITNVGFFALICVLSPLCGAILLFSVAVVYVIDVLRIKKDIKFVRQIKEIREKLDSKASENFKAIKEIKGLGAGARVLDKYNKLSAQLSAVELKKETSVALFNTIRSYFKHFIEAVLFVVAIVWLIPSGQLAAVVFITIVNYSGSMYDVVGFVTTMKDCFVKADLSAGRILEVLDKDNLEKVGNRTFGGEGARIEVKDLTFCFDDAERPVLDGVSFSIEKNSTIAIVGPSGAGKSTLFNLIARLYSAAKGKILFNGQDVSEISEDEFRNKVCLINQETFLFNETIMENLRVCENKTDEEIFEATKRANVHDEICALTDGYDTLVAENGANLSGGQKQRIAVSRALIKNASVMLFDEPTSALDSQNQQKFYEVLDSLRATKTIVVITHKLTDFSHFDRVYEVEDGKLTEIKK